MYNDFGHRRSNSDNNGKTYLLNQQLRKPIHESSALGAAYNQFINQNNIQQIDRKINVEHEHMHDMENKLRYLESRFRKEKDQHDHEQHRIQEMEQNLQSLKEQYKTGYHNNSKRHASQFGGYQLQDQYYAG